MTKETKNLLIIGALITGTILIMKASGDMISKMADAIKTFEGWAEPGQSLNGKVYPEGSTSYLNNNPGNLKMAGQAGAVGSDRYGHAIFGSYAEGWAALLSHINRALTGLFGYSPDMSLYDFFRKYAEANSAAYAEFVGSQLGVDPNSTLQQVLGG